MFFCAKDIAVCVVAVSCPLFFARLSKGAKGGKTCTRDYDGIPWFDMRSRVGAPPTRCVVFFSVWQFTVNPDGKITTHLRRPRTPGPVRGICFFPSGMHS